MMLLVPVEVGADFGTLLAAHRTDELVLKLRQPRRIGPPVGIDPDPVRWSAQ